MNRFTKKNEGFTCEHCSAAIPPAQKTCRNHCPLCLHSKHVDHFPGDRANECHGLMRPVGYETTGHKGLMLLFECSRCGEKTRNISQPDDAYDVILKL